MAFSKKPHYEVELSRGFGMMSAPVTQDLYEAAGATIQVSLQEETIQ